MYIYASIYIPPVHTYVYIYPEREREVCKVWIGADALVDPVLQRHREEYAASSQHEKLFRTERFSFTNVR